MKPHEIRDLLEVLANEYQYIYENRSKLKTDCEALRVIIDTQVQQTHQLSEEFISLQQRFLSKDSIKEHQNGNLDNQINMPQFCIKSSSLQNEEEQQKNASPEKHTTSYDDPKHKERTPPKEKSPTKAKLPPSEPADNEIQEQDWELRTFVQNNLIENPVFVALLAEIVDVSVICSTAFSPDGSCLAIGSDKTLRIYDIEKDTFILQYTISDGDSSISNHIRSICWSEDINLVICGSEDGQIRVFGGFPNAKLLQCFQASTGEVFQLHISHSGTFLAAVTGDALLSLFSMEDFTKYASMMRQQKEASFVATSLSISSDDRLAFVGYSDSAIALWDLSSCSILCEQICHEKDVYDVRYIEKNHRVATASLDAMIKIWDIVEKDGKVSLVLWRIIKGHSNFVLSLSTDPNEVWLLSGSKDLTAGLSLLSTGQMIYSIKAHTNSVISVCFSPTGIQFCTGSGDQSVKVWSITSEKLNEAS